MQGIMQVGDIINMAGTARYTGCQESFDFTNVTSTDGPGQWFDPKGCKGPVQPRLLPFPLGLCQFFPSGFHFPVALPWAFHHPVHDPFPFYPFGAWPWDNDNRDHIGGTPSPNPFMTMGTIGTPAVIFMLSPVSSLSMNGPLPCHQN